MIATTANGGQFTPDEEQANDRRYDFFHTITPGAPGIPSASRVEAATAMSREVESVTNSGFRCWIDPDRLDDWELARISIRARKGDTDAAVELCAFILDRVLTPANKARLFDHVRTADGRIPSTRLMAEVTEILTSTKAGKNSPSSAD